MVEYILPEKINDSGGLEWAFNYIGVNIPNFSMMMLFFIWFCIMTAGFFAQKRSLGRANFLMWGAIGGLITSTGAFVLYLLPKETPVIGLEGLIAMLTITILFNAFFWIQNTFGEKD